MAPRGSGIISIRIRIYDCRSVPDQSSGSIYDPNVSILAKRGSLTVTNQEIDNSEPKTMTIATASKAAETPEETALADERGGIPWSYLGSILNRATNALLNAGLDPGQRIAVFAENSAETVMGHLAGILAVISTVPVNFHLTAAELQYILEDSEAGLLMVGPETIEVGLEAARAANIPLVECSSGVENLV